jgi:circadian clock protein KaiB
MFRGDCRGAGLNSSRARHTLVVRCHGGIIPADRRIELVLYVSAASPSSVRAVANLKRILRRYPARRVAVSVCNLSEDPALGERDRIAFTPTLCKRAPEPPMWIIGDLSHPEPLVELLEFCGVAPAHGHRKAHHRHPRV